MNKIERIEKALEQFFMSYEPNMEHYFNQDFDENWCDPMDWSGGNFDDAMQHGYDAGENDAQQGLINLLNENGIGVTVTINKDGKTVIFSEE